MAFNFFGYDNVAIGKNALNLHATPIGSVSIGSETMARLIIGNYNVALGYKAMFLATNANNNIAIGASALNKLQTTNNNIAIGHQTLSQLLTGTENVAIGSDGTGNQYTGSESNNILISNSGVTGDNDVIRIGTNANQTSCYISGISGVTSAGGAAVVCNSAGQLGTVVSSRRFKRDIVDAKNYDVERLRVRNFKYISNGEDAPIEVGLIAEEVEEVLPELVIRETDGTPMTVNYNSLISILLQNAQQQRSMIDYQQKLIEHILAKI
jgi:hypothetical protein